jgi:hypothetical protein
MVLIILKYMYIAPQAITMLDKSSILYIYKCVSLSDLRVLLRNYSAVINVVMTKKIPKFNCKLLFEFHFLSIPAAMPRDSQLLSCGGTNQVDKLRIQVKKINSFVCLSILSIAHYSKILFSCYLMVLPE